MKDEIKEKIKAYYIGNDINKLLDYITNLQEENKKVHKDFAELSERYFFTKSRNEKAIEYIKANRNVDDYGKFVIEDDKNILLGILNGGDDNG